MYPQERIGLLWATNLSNEMQCDYPCLPRHSRRLISKRCGAELDMDSIVAVMGLMQDNLCSQDCLAKAK